MTCDTSRRGARLRWRWWFDSPLVLATWATMFLGAWSVQQVESTLLSAELVRRDSDRELAKVAAESAVMHVPLRDADVRSWSTTVGRVRVNVERFGDELVVASELPSGAVHRHGTRVVPGAAPAAFGSPMSRTVPELDPTAVGRAVRARDLPIFRRDGGVALLHFDGGTDLDDFVFDAERRPLDDVSSNVIAVAGHLWIEPGARPVQLSCARDLTILVAGNLYVGRSVEVLGPGRVVFVALGSDAARPFADLDGDGRRSRDEPGVGGAEGSAIEGGGNVHLGLPDSPEHLVFDGGLVVAGYLHVLRDARVHGPVAVARAPIMVDSRARLLASGQRTFCPEREVVPGFAVTGPPRAGFLSAVPAGSSGRDRQTLYLDAPAR